jgi:hypothetical protein
MSERLIEKISLPNGLILELYDQSRHMAGDRWLVSLLAKVEVPILPEYFYTLDHGEQAQHDLAAAYGDPLIFTQEKMRHFVDEEESEHVLADLCQRFKDTLVSYLGSPQFASSYVLKKYGDLRDRDPERGPQPPETSKFP